MLLLIGYFFGGTILSARHSLQQKAPLNDRRLADSLKDAGMYRDAARVYEKLINKGYPASTVDERAELLYLAGLSFMNASEEHLAKRYFIEVLDHTEKITSTGLVVDAMSGLGRCYEYLSRHDSAFIWYLEAYRRVEFSDDHGRKARDARNIAQLLRFLGRLDEAKKYGRQALELVPLLEDYRVEANIYNEIAYLYELSGDLDSAALYYRKLIDVSVENRYNAGESVGYSNLAEVLEKEQRYDEALQLKRKGLEIDRKMNDRYGMMTSWQTISSTLYAMGNYERSIFALDSAAALCDDRYLVDRMDREEGYYRNYRALGKPALALLHLERHNTLKDSVNAAESNRRVSELLARYEAESREQQVRILEQANTIQESRIRLQWAVIAGLLMLGVSMTMIGWLWIRNKNHALKRMNAELHHFLMAEEKPVSASEPMGEEVPSKAYGGWGLTERESEILWFMGQGCSNAVIAERMFISENTVKYHLKNIYIKLDVKNRIQALVRCNGPNQQKAKGKEQK